VAVATTQDLPMDSHDLIDSQEMYLRTVLELEEEGIPPLRARLVERLELSAPSVSEGVRRLIDDGLMVLNDDRTVGLTDRGRNQANRVMRKHRLAERLLIDVLEVAPEHVHEEACRWEHVISDRVEKKLFDFLGQPTTSPYGNPIPGVDELSDYEVLTLANSVGGRVRLERISELLQARREIMHALDEAGIRAGVEVGVERDADEGLALAGPVGRVPLDVDAATLLYVSEVDVA
jgi:DtxR family Mn-dependent transcriptional regulator